MTLWQDFRYALRIIRKKPSFATFVILVLALGLGADTTIFSLVDGALLRPLPYADPARLVLVNRKDRDQTGNAFSMALLNAVRERNAGIGSLAGFQYESFNRTDESQPARLQGMVVTANLFSTLGVKARLGRTFMPGEDQPGQPHIVMLSHDLWTRHFASDPRIVGRFLKLSGQDYRIVGVLPASFRFDRDEGLPGGFDSSPKTDLWTPLRIPANDRGNYLIAIARLRSGLSVKQAQARMNIVAQQIEHEGGNAPKGLSLSIEQLNREITKELETPLLILLAAVGLLLLVVCANVANLLLSRAAARKVEVSIRAALGAGRPRLARQLTTEYVVYALAGGAIGLVLAMWGLRLYLGSFPLDLLHIERAEIDWRVALFCFLLSLATGVAVGLAPLVTASRQDLNTAIKQGRSTAGGREGRAMRHSLISAEIAIAFVLLVGAGLLIRSFLNLLSVDPGFQPERVLTAQIDLQDTKYPDGLKMVAFFRSVVSHLRENPKVEAAGVVTILPMGGLDRDGPGFRIVGQSGSAGQEIPASVTMPLVSAGYFQAMNIPLRQGRFFTTADNESAPGVAIVNEACARRWFPKANPIGQQLSALGGRIRFTIVGVTGDVRHWGLDTPARPMIYAPYMQVPQQVMARVIRPMTLVVRGAGGIASLAGLMRAAVRGADSEQPISNVRTMSEVLARSLAQRRLLLTIMVSFGCAALLLALVGIYAVVSYSVSQRTGEIGIRIALGAQPSDVLGMILHQSMMPVVTGLLVGLGLSLASAEGVKRIV